MTRDELESLGMSDRELIDEVRRQAGDTKSRANPVKLSGVDTPEKQIARRQMFEVTMLALYSDPGIP